jgi:hypothetical protein
MTVLEQQQRGLLALLKRRPVEVGADPWLETVAASPALDMMQEIALWWRCYQISAACRFASRLLKQLGRFEDTVAQFFETRPTSAFTEELGRDFLGSLSADADPLVREVAATELHLSTLDGAEVSWDRNPNAVFAALDRFEPVPPPEPDYAYTLRVGRLLRCERVKIVKPLCAACR